jgi:hypothetical protein
MTSNAAKQNVLFVYRVTAASDALNRLATTYPLCGTSDTREGRNVTHIIYFFKSILVFLMPKDGNLYTRIFFLFFLGEYHG